MCSHQKQCLFGEIVNDKMLLNQIGKIVRDEWLKSSQIRQEIELDEWVIMPNHLHGIVIIQHNDDLDGDVAIDRNDVIDDKGASLTPPQRKPKSLSSFIAGFKSSVTKRLKIFCTQSNPRIWQRNYYESIVRNELHLNQIRHYIIDNPYKWAEDTEKPENDFQDLLIDFVF